ncbi:MAG: helix-turn-helix domain-containing protein [Nocardiopsaceae bacterium]|nr:helix-turn-helix domain-containing protein [Nocardiopsaceae bacterium]
MDYGDSGSASRFGALVRAYRLSAGLTQQELATKSGLSVAALRDFEQSRRYRPRPSSLAALVSALGLNADQAASLTRAARLPRHVGSMLASSPASSPSPDGSPPTAEGSPRAGRGLWLSALGPLEAWWDGRPLSLGPPARRAVLGLLMMNPCALTRRDVIIDALWGEAPPRTAVGLVQAHVSRLRKALDPPQRETGRQIITSVGGAYALRLSAGELDVLAFRELAQRAAAARAGGDDAAAFELYERAVGLWRGDPLADVGVLDGYPALTLLRQELIGVLLLYADVACALGAYSQALPRLQALAAAEPLNEPTHARLMAVLAGSGDQAAAIRVYEDLRTRLDRELGLYPGQQLVETHLRVLRQDIYATESGRGQARPAAHSAVHALPRQLPAAPRHFTGRSDELAALSGLVERDCQEADGIVIAALTGMAGVGKTALAVHWAHAVADQFPDGQLFVDLRGSSPSGTPVAPTDAVCGFLTALGVPAARTPADAAGQAALFRSLLVGRRMLIVLDNATDAQQIRPLLPGTPGCMVLVTSRNRLTGLAAADGAHLFMLGVLTESESRELLDRSLGTGRAAEEPEAVSETIALCARLPLALCDVAARVAARPRLPLAALAAEMRDERQRLDALETGESATSVRAVFSWSRARLSEPAERMFHLLGVHPGPDITVPAAASLAGLPRGEAYLILAELCDEHLLTEHAPGRYACHDLLRAYAAERARTCASDTERRAAVHRVLDHYLHTASAATAALYPDCIGYTCHEPLPGVRPEEIGDPGQAAEWFESERHSLLAAIGQAAEEGYAPHAWMLPWVTRPFFKGEAYWRKLIAAQEAALAIAGELGDPDGLALSRCHLGLLNFRLGENASACRHLDNAVEQATLGNRRLQAQVGHAICLFLLLSGWLSCRGGGRRAFIPPRGRVRMNAIPIPPNS